MQWGSAAPPGWSDGYCSSTDGSELRPWLYLDLGASDTIHSITIVTREDVGELDAALSSALSPQFGTISPTPRPSSRDLLCCAGGLHDVQIRVGNTLPTEGLSGDAVLSTNTLCDTYIGPAAADPNNLAVVNCSVPLIGRYVSFQVGQLLGSWESVSGSRHPISFAACAAAALLPSSPMFPWCAGCQRRSARRQPVTDLRGAGVWRQDRWAPWSSYALCCLCCHHGVRCTP